MRILAIETSCDETSSAVVEKVDEQKVRVHSNITATSLAIHAVTGGIIPENAAREQVKFIIPTIIESLLKSDPDLNNSKIQQFSNKERFEHARNVLKNNVDAIAVTYGPGLIGSLLVGVETVKTLSFTFNKPVIAVNHLLAHLFANFIESEISNHRSPITFPFIGLIVSGGHTDLLLFQSLKDYKWLGGTRDDAAGEALDKIGRLLNLPYPAGPEIERRANLHLKSKNQDSKNKIQFHSPMIGTKDFDFSFSGLKAEVSRFVKEKKLTDELIDVICNEVQNAIFSVLIKKTVQACLKYNCSTILLGGGVCANQTLLERFRTEHSDLKIIAPEKQYSTDNGAMIGAYAALNPETKLWKKIESQPDLYFYK